MQDDYLVELEKKFIDTKFERIVKIDGKYVTNPKNLNTGNDIGIFIETQVKRTLRGRLSPFVRQAVKTKLGYFYQNEDQDETKIYQRDLAQDLQSQENYSIQNIGHATQLIQLRKCNILTDPVHNDLSGLFYPEKTASHPSIENLPEIDVILISHNHRDHVDSTTLKKLAEHHKRKQFAHQPKLYIPLGDRAYFEQFDFNEIVEVDWYRKVPFVTMNNESVNFICIPSDHRSGRNLIDHHKSLVIGWIINPENENVIIKYSGDTRQLTEKNQQAIDAILWNEINHKRINEAKTNENIEIPDIICLEPSGPNYTRFNMDLTHQSTSYSALLKFKEAKNLANLSGKRIDEFLAKIKTVMMHHNKFELGPDRFNEGLFVIKKLLNYLNLNEDELNQEWMKQKMKLKLELDRKKLKESTPFTSRVIISTLPQHTSLLVRSKDFIIEEIKHITEKLDGIDKEQIKNYIIQNTIFPKIGQRLNDVQLKNSQFHPENVQKYNKL